MGCLQRFINLIATVIVLVALIGVGAYFLLLGFMEGKLADSLRRRFMLPPSSTVEVERGSVFDTLAGRVRAIHIRATEAKLSGVAMRDLSLDTGDVEFDLASLILRRGSVLKRVSGAQVKVAVTPDALAEAWLERGRRVGLKELTLKLIPPDEGESESRAEVTARVEALGRQWQLKGSGAFRLTDDKEIGLSIAEFEVVGLQTGKDVFESIFVQFAPRIRLSELQTELVIDDFAIRDDRLVVSAHSPGAIQPVPESGSDFEEVQ